MGKLIRHFRQSQSFIHQGTILILSQPQRSLKWLVTTTVSILYSSRYNSNWAMPSKYWKLANRQSQSFIHQGTILIKMPKFTIVSRRNSGVSILYSSRYNSNPLKWRVETWQRNKVSILDSSRYNSNRQTQIFNISCLAWSLNPLFIKVQF